MSLSRGRALRVSVGVWCGRLGWLQQEGVPQAVNCPPNRGRSIYGQGRLIDWITGSVDGLDEGRSEALYREASVEARALAGWLKRFAEAFIAAESP